MSIRFSKSRGASRSIKIKKILDEYFQLNDEYINNFGEYDDAIFGYTEMANVAAFSTAAWRQKFVSMVEYQDSKYGGKNLDKNKKSKYKNGRVDLYITNRTEEYICEAKQCFTRGGNIKTEKIYKMIRSAYEDVRRSTKCGDDENLDGYALIFLPHLSSKNLSMDWNDIIQKSVKSLYDDGVPATEETEKIIIDGYGYYFPSKPISGWTKSGDRNLLGVSVLFVRVKN